MDAKMKSEVLDIVGKEIEKHFPKAWVVEMKGDVEKLTRHLDKYEKRDDEREMFFRSLQVSLSKIETSLIPNDLNNNKGLITELADAKEVIQKQGDTLIAHKVYFALFGSAIVLLLASVIPLVIKVFLKQP